MSSARHDTDAFARFLATVRPDWNLGTVATQLTREHADPDDWPQLTLVAVELALTHPDATAARLHDAVQSPAGTPALPRSARLA